MRIVATRLLQFAPAAARIVAAISAAVALSACEVRSPAGPSGGESANVSGSELSFCADELNRYRASIGRPVLTRSGQLETFAAQSAEHDGTAHVAHHHFLMTNGGGTAMAETEILWWKNYAVKSVIRDGLAQMWQAGPGGEHYDIIAGPYTEVGCGVFINNGEVTVTQDFR